MKIELSHYVLADIARHIEILLQQHKITDYKNLKEINAWWLLRKDLVKIKKYLENAE